MEYLSRALKVACATPYFKYHTGCKKHGLVHLMFVDGLILFCAADLKSVQWLMSAFQEFCMTTGLEANYNKSEIVIRGCKPHREQEILHATGFSAGALHLRYLGILITASRLSKMECRSMVDKITARIKTWSIRNLSYAGKAALIQSVLLGIFTF